MFIGSKNSGKTYGLVKMIKNYEDKPVKDSKGNTLEIKTILFSPTGKSEANPIYTSLKSLDFENDVIENYTDNKLIEKLNKTVLMGYLLYSQLQQLQLELNPVFLY